MRENTTNCTHHLFGNHERDDISNSGEDRCGKFQISPHLSCGEISPSPYLPNK